MSIPQNLKENRLQLKFCSALLLRLPAISLPLRPPLWSTVPLYPSLVHTVTNRRLLPHPVTASRSLFQFISGPRFPLRPGTSWQLAIPQIAVFRDPCVFIPLWPALSRS